jgi:two-component system sensor histidine kinase/response regulator
MRVSQVLANLVSNAVKFTAEGEVVIEVGAATGETGVVNVRFDVRDTGIGIAPDKIHRLFEPFTQADAGTTRRFGGTGLGLTISHELTRLIGGTITAQSEMGKGSVFSFTIPFERAHAQPSAPVPAAGLRGLHVLVVDDNATNRRVFEAYLASWGMRPDVARDAGEAMARLRTAARKGDRFDLALLDFNMPGESGVQLGRRISASPSLRPTQLILITSSAHAEADAAEAGIRYHLTKPVRQSRLLEAISLVMAPMVRDHDEPERERQPERASSTRARSRILVAEDQDVNWLLIDRLLAKRGHVAVNARDGRRTVDALVSGHYDLVLMDCPAHAMLGDRERCIAAGMDDYLAKPIGGQELDAVLERWLPGEVQPASLDESRLEELRSLFPGEELSRVVRELVADVREQIERITAAAGAGDRATVSDAAHRLKNSALMVGARDLAEGASRLEDLARHDQADGHAVLSSALDALSERWRATRAAIETGLGP